MRKDYDYVDKATAIEITTTREGDAYIDSFGLSDPNVYVEDVTTKYPEVDLLMFLQDEYVTIEGTDDITIRRMFETVVEYFRSNFECECPYTLDMFVRMFENGYVGFKKIIWDCDYGDCGLVFIHLDTV